MVVNKSKKKNEFRLCLVKDLGEIMFLFLWIVFLFLIRFMGVVVLY